MFKPEYQADRFYHWHRIPVRFRDLDLLNHVNNAVYSSYFEDARVHFVAHQPDFARSMRDDKSFVLASITIDFLKPILFPSVVLVGSSILKTGNTSMEAIQAIYNEETKALHAVATTRGVWFDLKTKRPAKLPDITDLEKMMFREH